MPDEEQKIAGSFAAFLCLVLASYVIVSFFKNKVKFLKMSRLDFIFSHFKGTNKKKLNYVLIPIKHRKEGQFQENYC